MGKRERLELGRLCQLAAQSEPHPVPPPVVETPALGGCFQVGWYTSLGLCQNNSSKTLPLGGGGPGRKLPAVAQAGGLVFGNFPQRTCATFLEVVSMTAEADCGEGNAGQPGRDSTWATGRGLTKDLKTHLPSGQCQPHSLGWSDRQPRLGIFSERSPHMSGKFSSVHVQRAFCVPCFQAAYKV